MWGTVGITYNVDMVKERLPNADLKSSTLLFKPENAAKLADCGITMLEARATSCRWCSPISARIPNTDQPGRFRCGGRGLQADPPIHQDLRRRELPERPSQQGTVRHQQLVGRLCDRQDARRRKPASRSISPITCRRRARPPGSTYGSIPADAPNRGQRLQASSTTCWSRKSSPSAPTSPTTPMPTWRPTQFIDKAVLGRPGGLSER